MLEFPARVGLCAAIGNRMTLRRIPGRNRGRLPILRNNVGQNTDAQLLSHHPCPLCRPREALVLGQTLTPNRNCGCFGTLSQEVAIPPSLAIAGEPITRTRLAEPIFSDAEVTTVVEQFLMRHCRVVHTLVVIGLIHPP